jgi:hypothetical protein
MISFNDIERAFNEDRVAELAKIANLPPGADLTRFAANLRLCARLFLEAKGRMSTAQLRKTINHLYSLVRCAESSSDIAAQRLALAVEATPAELWGRLPLRTPQARKIPTPKEILSPKTRDIAVERLRLILSLGGYVGLGRKREGGRRSRSFKPLLRLPEKGGRGRPRGEAERDFVQNLALTYLEATDMLPPDTANYNIDIRGPFSRFVHRCFDLVGAPSGSVTRLINELGPRRREARRRIAQQGL